MKRERGEEQRRVRSRSVNIMSVEKVPKLWSVLRFTPQRRLMHMYYRGENPSKKSYSVGRWLFKSCVG